MIRFHWGEKWKEVLVDERNNPKKRYAITNYGRVISFTDDIMNGYLVRPCKMRGDYQVVTIRINETTRKKFYIHRLVAEHFLEKESPDQEYVLHINYDKTKSWASNLKWATKIEKDQHIKNNPVYLSGHRKAVETRKGRDGHKLTATQVMRLKKMINDPNRTTRLKIIARQFNISEMQLYRIKSGENWGYIEG